MIPLPSSIQEILVVLACVITLYLISKYIINPYLLLSHYKKQGATTLFHHRFFSFPSNFKNLLEKGDFYYRYNEIVKNNPDTRCIVENFGDKVLFIPTEADLVKEFLKKYEVYYKARESAGLTPDLLNGSLILTEGPTWKKHRKIMTGALNYELLKDVVPTIVDVAQRNITDWINNADLDKFNLGSRFGTVAGEVAGTFFFGKKFTQYRLWGLPIPIAIQDTLVAVGTENSSWSSFVFGAGFARKNILPRHRKINQRIVELRKKCLEMIKENETEDKNGFTMLDLLLNHQKTCPPEEKLSEENLCGKFLGIYLGGTDTSSLLMTSAIYYLSKYPHILKRLRAEVDELLRDPSSLTMDTVSKMEYSTAFLKECLRVGSSMGSYLLRVATKDDKLGGIDIKKGTLMNVFIPVLHHNKKYFPDPETFNPDRWLTKDNEEQEQAMAENNAFISFSSGPRNCMGQYLGLTNTKIVVGLFVKTFDWDLDKDYKMRLVQRVSFPPLEPVMVKLRLRDVKSHLN